MPAKKYIPNIDICAIDGCKESASSKNLCPRHYMAQYQRLPRKPRHFSDPTNARAAGQSRSTAKIAALDANRKAKPETRIETGRNVGESNRLGDVTMKRRMLVCDDDNWNYALAHDDGASAYVRRLIEEDRRKPSA